MNCTILHEHIVPWESKERKESKKYGHVRFLLSYDLKTAKMSTKYLINLRRGLGKYHAIFIRDFTIFYDGVSEKIHDGMLFLSDILNS